MSEFFEAYKDPRWQRKRLEIMQREDFACERCGSKEETLNVHHAFYRKGKKPWEYESSILHCLCESCHNEAHAEKERAMYVLSMMDADDAKVSIAYMEAWVACRRCQPVFISDTHAARGFCDFWVIPLKEEDLPSLVGRTLDEWFVREAASLYFAMGRDSRG